MIIVGSRLLMIIELKNTLFDKRMLFFSLWTRIFLPFKAGSILSMRSFRDATVTIKSYFSF